MADDRRQQLADEAGRNYLRRMCICTQQERAAQQFFSGCIYEGHQLSARAAELRAPARTDEEN